MFSSSYSVSMEFSLADPVEIAVYRCKKVLERDFGPGRSMDCKPDVLLLARDAQGTVVGVVGLELHEPLSCWEIVLVTSSIKRAHFSVLRFLLNNEAAPAIRRWFGEKDAWIFLQIGKNDTRLQKAMVDLLGFDAHKNLVVKKVEFDRW